MVKIDCEYHLNPPSVSASACSRDSGSNHLFPQPLLSSMVRSYPCSRVNLASLYRHACAHQMGDVKCYLDPHRPLSREHTNKGINRQKSLLYTRTHSMYSIEYNSSPQLCITKKKKTLLKYRNSFFYRPVPAKPVLPKSGPGGPLLVAKNGPPGLKWAAKSGPTLPKVVHRLDHFWLPKKVRLD